MKFETTQDIVNRLMSNSSLSQSQQRELSSLVDSKQMTRKNYINHQRDMYGNTVYNRDYNYNPTMFGNRSYYSRKKTLDQMKQQNPNLYVAEKPKKVKTVNREALIDDLALAMEYSGKMNIPKRLLEARKNGGIKKKSVSNVGSSLPPKNTKSAADIRFDECMAEIEERMNWLNEMRELGNAAPYEAIVKAQCSQLLQEMRQITKGKEDTKQHIEV